MAGTRIARSGVERTNPETTRLPQEERVGGMGEEEEGCTSPYNIPPHLSQLLLGFSRRSQTLPTEACSQASSSPHYWYKLIIAF